jgi:hypothetical protein
MTNVEFWTRAAIAVLIAAPPVIFVMFLKDAARLYRELHARPDTAATSDRGAGPRDA